MKFEEPLHTPSALMEELEAVYSDFPRTLLVGSLGRAVLYGEVLGDAMAEFQVRGETPERKVEYDEVVARDIDVVGSGSTHHAHLAPFEVDHHPYNCRQVRLLQDGQDWWLASETKNLHWPLHPAVMEPVEGETVYGVKAATVPHQTHLALFGLRGTMRPKDRANRDQLAALAVSTDKLLPPELLEPFDRLRVLANSGVMHHTRRLYRTVLPSSIRHKLAPHVHPIRDRFA